jgi:YYY domain-containing protein
VNLPEGHLQKPEAPAYPADKAGWVSPLLLIILTIALALRLYGITWDQGNFFHPDERSIYMRVDCMYRLLTEAPGYQACTRDIPFTNVQPGFPGLVTFLDADRSPLNPHWFPLGTMVIYLLLLIKLALAPIVTMDLGDLAFAGRTLAALADVGTVAMVYLLGRRLFGKWAGLLAATLVTFAVVHIQLAHFYRPEPFTNLFTLAAFWFMLQVLERRRVRDSAMLGLFIGLAFATKLSVLPLLVPLALLYGYLLRRILHDSAAEERPKLIERLAVRLLVAGATAAAIYIFWTPYAILSFPELLGWNLREVEIIRNAGIVPYTVQYIGTTNLLYELRQTILWGLGPLLGVLAWGGFLATIAVNVRRPRIEQVLMLAWAIPLLLIVVSVEVKFLRYTFPLMPVFILLGTGTALAGYHWLREHHPSLRVIATAAIGVVLATTVLYALAFESIYTRPHTAVQASDWINENVAPSTTVLTDNHWDEGIPNLGAYRVLQLPMFNGDTQPKMESVAALLADAEYLVFYSNRTYGAIARVPERYYLSSNYYRLLFSGELGYELEESFDSYPRLLGVALVNDTFSRAGLTPPAPLKAASVAPVALNMGYADNDAITYDHPLTLVFRNVAYLDSIRLAELLLAPQPPFPPALALMLTPEELITQQTGGTWAQIFDLNSLSNRFPVLTWLLLVQLASVVVLPLGFLIFRGLTDRGYLLSKVLAMLLLAFFPWLMAALKLMDFDRTSIYLGLGLLAVAGVVITLRNRHEMVAFIRERWRTLALEEALFLGAFVLFLTIRWANPDLWHPFRGGEKPMDFAYLTAVVRSTTVPPYDPWFAGGYLNYYYFGQFIIATLIKATGILPEVAYNLAIPLLFAMTIVGSFSVVYNLTHAMRQRQDTRGPSWGPALAGIGASLLVAVLGNLGGGIQLVKRLWSNVTSSLPPEGDAFHVWFWVSSRMIPDQNSITEFPAWSFLFSDLHAHMIAIPFTILVIGLALALVLTARSSGFGWRNMALPLTALGLTVGSLYPINTWDYPTYLMLAAGAVLLAAYTSRRRLDRGLLTRAAVGVAVVAGVSYLAFLPFHIRNLTFDAGIHASLEKTSIQSYLAVHGLFIVLVVSYLVYETRRRLKGGMRSIVGWSPFALSMIGGALLVVAYLVAASYATVALLFILGLAVAVLIANRLLDTADDSPFHLYILLMMGGALAIGAVVDLVTVNNDVDRMNTVFKLYLQSWVLYSLAAAAILWYLLTSARFSWRGINLGRGTWAALLLVLVAGTAVFPIQGTRVRLAERFTTEFTGINGAEYMEYSVYYDSNGLVPGEIQLKWDWEAIQWLRDTVEGSPVIAEGNTAPVRYLWGSRVSIYTGMPTIIGWDWHQTQQRLGEQAAVVERVELLNTLFSTTDHALAEQILREYGVAYVYIGELERLYYPEEGLAKFAAMADRGLTRVYSNPQVDIYQVKLTAART